MVKESNEGILEQLHDIWMNSSRLLRQGIRASQFASAKSLAEELMANHAQQPTKRFMGKGHKNTSAPIAHSYTRQQLIELSMSSLI